MLFGSFCASLLGHIDNQFSCFISYIQVDVSLLQDFWHNAGAASIDILVRLKKEKITAIKQEGILKKFKLTSTISTNNMYLFDAKGYFQKYDNPEQSIKPLEHGIIWDNVVFFLFPRTYCFCVHFCSSQGILSAKAGVL